MQVLMGWCINCGHAIHTRGGGGWKHAKGNVRECEKRPVATPKGNLFDGSGRVWSVEE